MSNPDAAQVLTLLADWLEAKRHAEGDPLVFTHWEEHRKRCRPLQIAIEALDPAHLRTLALARAEALEREAALLEALQILHEGWERDGILLYAQETIMEADGTATWLDRECKTEHDTLRRCADELEAALNNP